MIRVGFYSLLTVAWIVMFFYALSQDNGLVVALSIFINRDRNTPTITRPEPARKETGLAGDIRAPAISHHRRLTEV